MDTEKLPLNKSALKRSYCKGCNAPIVWARNTQTGKMIPMDPRPVCYAWHEADGGLICSPSDAMVSHFNTCSAAFQFSHKNQTGGAKP